MGVAARSRDDVEVVLATWEESFGSFPVNQTTVSVPSKRFERQAKRCREGIARVAARVSNEAGEVLLLDDDGNSLPAGIVEMNERLDQCVRRIVRQTAGVDCAVRELLEVTIAGVHDESDPSIDPVYRLVAVVACDLVGETTVRGTWQRDPPSPTIF